MHGNLLERAQIVAQKGLKVANLIDKSHVGSPLPRALFVNDVGYLPDGTPLNMAGNNLNHPATW